jgi:hypothetical protein
VTFVPQVAPLRKKKKKTGLYVWLASGGVALLCLIIFWHSISGLGQSLYTKYVHHDSGPPPPQEPTNLPPPPPPELTAEDILQNVGDKYKSLTACVVRGQSVAAIDISGIRPNSPLQNSSEAVSLEMARPNLYRLEWETKATGNGTPFKGAAWSAGKGDFVGYGPYPATKNRNRETAMTTAFEASEAQCITLLRLFFDETNSVAKESSVFAKTNGPTIPTQINNRNCYVLDGEFDAHDLVLWIDKDNFLVRQIQFVFGGKLDDSTLKEKPPALRRLLTTWSKLKGTITETYGAPILDTNLTAAVFEKPFTPSSENIASMGGQPPPGRARLAPPPRGTSPTSPTQLTRRVRPDQ